MASTLDTLARACEVASTAVDARERSAAQQVLSEWEARPDALVVARALAERGGAAGQHALRVARAVALAGTPSVRAEAARLFVDLEAAAWLSAALYKLGWPALPLPQLPRARAAAVVEMDVRRCGPLGAPLGLHRAVQAAFEAQVLPALLSPAEPLVVLHAALHHAWGGQPGPLVVPPALLPALERVAGALAATPSPDAVLWQCWTRLSGCAALAPQGLLEGALRLASRGPPSLPALHALRKCAQRAAARAPAPGSAGQLEAWLAACLDVAVGADGDGALFVDAADECFALLAAWPALDAAPVYGAFVRLLGTRLPALAQLAASAASAAGRVPDTLEAVHHVVRGRCPAAALAHVGALLASPALPAHASGLVCLAHLAASHPQGEFADMPAVWLHTPGLESLLRVVLLERLQPTAPAALHSALLLVLLHVAPVYVNARSASPYDALCGPGPPATQLLAHRVLPYLGALVRHPDAPRVLRVLLKCTRTGPLVVRCPAWRPLVGAAVAVAAAAPQGVVARTLLEAIVCAAAHFKSVPERAAYLREVVAALPVALCDTALRALVAAAPPGLAVVVRELFLQHVGAAARPLKAWTRYAHSGLLAALDEQLWMQLADQWARSRESPSRRWKLLGALCRLGPPPPPLRELTWRALCAADAPSSARLGVGLVDAVLAYGMVLGGEGAALAALDAAADDPELREAAWACAVRVLRTPVATAVAARIVGSVRRVLCAHPRLPAAHIKAADEVLAAAPAAIVVSLLDAPNADALRDRSCIL